MGKKKRKRKPPAETRVEVDHLSTSSGWGRAWRAYTLVVAFLGTIVTILGAIIAVHTFVPTVTVDSAQPTTFGRMFPAKVVFSAPNEYLAVRDLEAMCIPYKIVFPQVAVELLGFDNTERLPASVLDHSNPTTVFFDSWVRLFADGNDGFRLLIGDPATAGRAMILTCTGYYGKPPQCSADNVTGTIDFANEQHPIAGDLWIHAKYRYLWLIPGKNRFRFVVQEQTGSMNWLPTAESEPGLSNGPSRSVIKIWEDGKIAEAGPYSGPPQSSK